MHDPVVCPGVWDGPARALALHRKKILEREEKAKGGSPAETLGSLLSNLCLDEKYLKLFDKMTMEAFIELSDEDLKAMGILLLGPRRKLTSVIRKERELREMDPMPPSNNCQEDS